MSYNLKLLLLSAFTFFLLQAFNASAQCTESVLLDNTSFAGNSENDSLQWSHTIGTGNYRLLAVAIGTQGEPPDSVMLGSAKLKLAGRVENGVFDLNSTLWYLTDPPSGEDTITVISNANSYITAAAYSFSGVEPSRPFRNIEEAQIEVDENVQISQSVQSTSGDYVFDFFNFRMSGAGDLTLGANQTKLFERNDITLRRQVSSYSAGTNGTVIYTYQATRDISQGAYLLVSVNCKMNVASVSFQELVQCTNEDPVTLGGDPTAIGGIGPYTYSWSPAAELDDPAAANPKAFPAATTTFSVTVTDQNDGSSAVSTQLIEVHDPPANPDAGPSDTICEGSVVYLKGSGGTSYHWEHHPRIGNHENDTAYAYPTDTATFTLEVFNESGCSAFDSVIIYVLPAPPAYAGEDTTICMGDSAQLNASGGVSYIWDEGDTLLSDSLIPNPIATPPRSWGYIVTVTDSIGCTASDTVIVYVTTPATTNDRTICEGEVTTIGAGNGVEYIWSPLDSMNNDTSDAYVYAHPTVTTTYYVTITGATGCVVTDSVVVNVLPMPDMTISPSSDTTICKGESIQLGATGGVDYEWRPNIYLDDDDFQNPVATPDTTVHYYVYVQAENGCVDTIGVTVNVLEPSIMVSVFPTDTTVCPGDQVQLQATSTGTSFNWSPSAGLSCSDCADPVATPNSETTYTVAVPDSGTACEVKAEVNISFNDITSVEAGPDALLCKGQSKQLNATVSGSGKIYTWSPATGLSCTDCEDPVASPAETTTYTLEASSSGICPGTDQVVITVQSCSGMEEQHDLNSLEIYPNPFRSETSIQYELSKASNVQIEVYDELGRHLGTLVNEQQSGGIYKYQLSPEGTESPAGVYFIKFSVDGTSFYKRAVAIK